MSATGVTGVAPTGGGGSGTPSDTVVAETTYGIAPAAGAATTYARGDHTHGTQAAPSIPSASSTVVAETTYGASSTAGAAGTFSRGDHTHGTQTLPTPAAIGASATGHVHVESDVTSLVTDLAAKQPSSANLTTIAGLTPTTGNVVQSVAGAWASQTPAQVKTSLALAAADVGLGNVTNTSDANKPVSTAQQTALNLKADLAGPTFTGTPTLPTGTVAVTQTAGNSTTALATTAFATTADNLKANLASPTFTGTPTLPTGAIGVTQTAGNSTTALATTAFVTTADNLKANLASPTFTGTPTLPTGSIGVTQTSGDNTTALATTAFVQTASGLLVPKSLYTTKGDLAVATAANTPARLGVGADTFVLTADSAQASGMKWAAAAGGSGGASLPLALNPPGGRWAPIPVGRAGSNYTPVVNRLHLVPLPIGPNARQITGVSVEVATAAGAGGLGRMCLFSTLAGSWEPNLEIIDWGTKITTATGALNWTGLTQNVSPNTLYWVGFNPTVASPALRGVDGYNPYVNLSAAVTGSASFGMYVMTGVSASTGATPFAYFDVDLAIRVSVQFA